MSPPRDEPRYFALIPAAGVGARMGAGCPKQYLPIADVPMLRRTVDAFLASPLIEHTFVVVSPDDAYVDAVIEPGLPGVTVLRCGGASRRESVLNGLQAMPDGTGQDWVLVHDAARPGLTPALIERLIARVGQDAVGGLLALPVVDTVKQVLEGRVSTIPRETLWLAQTPQMFRRGLLEQALLAVREREDVTDEASALELSGLLAAGSAPKLVEGDPCNLKVTLAGDIATAEMYLNRLTKPANP